MANSRSIRRSITIATRQAGAVAAIGFAFALATVSIAGVAAGAAVSQGHATSVAAPWAPWGQGKALGVNPDVEQHGPPPAQLSHIAGQTESVDSSLNWSGLVDTGTTFSGVSAQWTVPTVPATQSATSSGTWVGIDGAFNSSLIQTGTAQQSSGGVTSYFAWYEILPASLVPIGLVTPGDQMSASVVEDSPGTWTISIADLTSDQSSTGSVSYGGPATSAEWIEEVPTSTPQPALADFGSAPFTGLEVSGADPSSIVGNPTLMVNPSGVVMAYPTFGNDTMTVNYGQAVSQTTVSTNEVVPTGTNDPQGASVAYSATLTGNVGSPGNGSVSFSIGSTPLCTAAVANGFASCTSSAAPAGLDTVTGTYSGDDVYAGSSGTTPLDVMGSQHGYWLVGTDGGIFTFGSAQFYGSTGSLKLQKPVVGIVPTTDDGGYWLDATDGGVFAYGDTQFYGSITGLGIHPSGSGLPDSLDAPIVGMVPSVDDGGYFMVGADGGVFAFGDAKFEGSCPGIGGCAGAAVAVMPDATGNGYWVVTATGHVYTFGDAPYFGAPGPQSVPVTSAVRAPNGEGYMMLFSNGAIASYGQTAFDGCPVTSSYGGLNPATAIFVTSDGQGYWIATADGSVLSCGDAPNDGSMAGKSLNGSIIAATGW
jgi:hypothetical protein